MYAENGQHPHRVFHVEPILASPACHISADRAGREFQAVRSPAFHGTDADVANDGFIYGVKVIDSLLLPIYYFRNKKHNGDGGGYIGPCQSVC